LTPPIISQRSGRFLFSMSYTHTFRPEVQCRVTSPAVSFGDACRNVVKRLRLLASSAPKSGIYATVGLIRQLRKTPEPQENFSELPEFDACHEIPLSKPLSVTDLAGVNGMASLRVTNFKPLSAADSISSGRTSSIMLRPSPSTAA